MSIFRWISSEAQGQKEEKSSEATLALSENQKRIINILRNGGKKERKNHYRVKILNLLTSQSQIKKEYINPPKPPTGNLNLSMPCMITSKAKLHLQNLIKSKNAKNIVFKDGLKHNSKLEYQNSSGEFHNLGRIVVSDKVWREAKKTHFSGFLFDLEDDSNELTLYVKFPNTSLELISDQEQISQKRILKSKLINTFKLEKLYDVREK